MSTAMMSAPSSARRTAWLRPWPRAAPVMKATLPSTRPPLLSSLNLAPTSGVGGFGLVGRVGGPDLDVAHAPGEFPDAVAALELVLVVAADPDRAFLGRADHAVEADIGGRAVAVDLDQRRRLPVVHPGDHLPEPVRGRADRVHPLVNSEGLA